MSTDQAVLDYIKHLDELIVVGDALAAENKKLKAEIFGLKELNSNLGQSNALRGTENEKLTRQRDALKAQYEEAIKLNGIYWDAIEDIQEVVDFVKKAVS